MKDITAGILLLITILTIESYPFISLVIIIIALLLKLKEINKVWE